MNRILGAFLCSFLLFMCPKALGTQYHITSSSEFVNTSSWVNVYDTIYLDNDIDVSTGTLKPINSFTGEFNGKGHSIKGINISTTGNAALFLITNNAYIHDVKLYGKIVSTSTDAKKSVSLINTAKSTTLKNIENHIGFLTTSPQASIAGFVCATDQTSLLIESCQYCDTIIVRPSSCPPSNYGGTYAFNQCAGIIATLKDNDKVDNCLFNGHIWTDVPYNPTPIVNTKNNNTVEGYNYDGNLGGIAGYCGAATKTSGIKNCLVTGTFNLNGNWYKNQGAVAGIISTNADNSNNYFCNDTLTNASTTTSRPGEGNSTSRNPGETSSTEVDESQVDDGEVYELLNSGGGENWGQYPTTPYNDNNGNYVIEYFSFDDGGNETKFPQNAVSLFVNNIVYKRPAKYVKGMMSVCLPFEVSKEDGTLPEGDIYEYCHTETDENGYVTCVHFKLSSNQETIPAGEAVFFKPLVESVDWEVYKHDTYIEMNPTHGVLGGGEHDDRIGINGTFNTNNIGSGFFKLNSNGDNLVYTLQQSNCYPFRAYIKLPDDCTIQTSSNAPVRVRFNSNDTPTGIEDVVYDAPKKVLINGNIIIIRNNRKYTIDGKYYE